MADALDLGSSGVTPVKVQVLSPAPVKSRPPRLGGLFVFHLIYLLLDFETLNLEIPKYQGVEGDINRRTTTLLPIQERVLD
jgi:hypothetical protein